MSFDDELDFQDLDFDSADLVENEIDAMLGLSTPVRCQLFVFRLD